MNGARVAGQLPVPDNGDVTIDEARVEDAAKWDGLHSILIHGADDLDAQDVIARYHQLWEIEACFRTNKYDFKIRPIYHWSPQRIRVHIAICCMAFCCLQYLHKRLNMLGHPMGPARVRKGNERSADFGPSPQERRRTICHAKPRNRRRKMRSDMRWPDLERGSFPDASGTDAQDQPTQMLKLITV